MREWFILFLLLSLQINGYHALAGRGSNPSAERVYVSANGLLTVPIGGSGTGEAPGDGSETGTEIGSGTETGAGIETGED